MDGDAIVEYLKYKVFINFIVYNGVKFMIKKMIGLSGLCLMLLSFNLSAESINLNAESITNKLFEDMRAQGSLSNLDENELDDVRQNLMNDVEHRLDLVKTGELSLDPEAPNYFLFDTLQNIGNAILNVAKGVVTTVVNVGKKAFNAVKGVLGTVIDVGLGFLGMVDNDFVKTVITGAAKAFGAFGPFVGDFVSFIPVVGPIISMAIDVVAPVVSTVVSPGTLDLVTGAISTAANAIGLTKNAIESATSKASLAPSPSILFASNGITSLSAAPAEASKADKTKAITDLGKVCKNLLTYLSGLSADAYNALKESQKLAAAQCNQLAKEVNAKIDVK